MALDAPVCWKVREVDCREVLNLMQRFGLSEIISRLLCLRGVGCDQVEWFLNPLIKRSLPDPFHLLGMQSAVEALVEAVKTKKNIAIYGDYDVDGACSIALVKLYLKAIGRDAVIYVPDRMAEGYGPNARAFSYLKQEKKIDLCITVDCGTVANPELEHAANIGLQVIVIDHHISSDSLPQAAAIINPNRFDQPDSPCKNLAAVGVVFLFLVAMNKTLRAAGFFADIQEPHLMQYLDLVALGTVCDVVKLQGINRSLVFQGLKVIAKRANLGLSALIDVLDINEPISAYHLGYLIGPNINAGGRIGKSSLGAELLSCEDKSTALDLSTQLYFYNEKRKAIELQVINASMGQIGENYGNFVMVVGEGWHPGIIGIVASRIKDKVNVPVVVVALDGQGLAKASARSVPGIDFGSAVLAAKLKGLIEAGGGHSMAAGFTAKACRLEEIKEFFSNQFGDPKPQIKQEADVAVSLNSINSDLVAQVSCLAPFGSGNPEPVFLVEGLKIISSKIVGERHISCIIASKHGGSSLKGIAFRGVEKPFSSALMSKRAVAAVVGRLKVNYWNGRESVDLIIEDVIL